MTAPLLCGALPPGFADDGVIAILGALLLFVVPAGDGRPILVWKEAKAAPWDIIMMFGGGLALAEAIPRAGLAVWLGERLTMLNEVPLVPLALVFTALLILVTVFPIPLPSASGF